MMMGGSSSPAPSPPRFPGGELPDRSRGRNLDVSSDDRPRNTGEQLPVAGQRVAPRKKRGREEQHSHSYAARHRRYGAPEMPDRDQNTRCEKVLSHSRCISRT